MKSGTDALSGERAELLERLLRQRRIELPEAQAIPRRAASGPCPLSYAQQRMWFLNQLEPDSPLYNGATTTRWSGPLDAGALERSLTEVVRRHEVLRTLFPLTDQGVIQQVTPVGGFHLAVRDLAGLPAGVRNDEALKWAGTEASRPFDLTREPPFRAALMRVAADEHILVLVIHHIASDRWSWDVLRRELAMLYSAFSAGRPSPLPELPIQYGDYAAWQHEHLQGEVLERELAYWRERLRGAPAVLELPTDRPRPAAQTFAGAQVSFTLPIDLVKALTALANSEQASVFMVLLAGFKALLARCTGRTDLVVGVPTAGRMQVELESLVGCFTNTLLVRTDLSGNPAFREILQHVREAALSGFDHQDLPFEKLVEELHPPRNPRYHPLFQVLFNYLDFSRAAMEIPGLRVEGIAVDRESALVDLHVAVRRSGESLSCHLTYNVALFDASTVAGLAGEYQALLEVAAAEPERRLLTLLPEQTEAPLDETERLLRGLDELSDEEAERLLAAELPDRTS